MNDYNDNGNMDVEGFTPRPSKCACMYHDGEFAIVECTIDPAQTAHNTAALAGVTA